MENIYARRLKRKVALAFALAASSVVAVAATATAEVSVASAATPISVTAPRRFKEYTTNRNEWLPAFRVANNTSFDLVVSVSFSKAPKGTKFSISNTAGLTLKYGYPSWTKQSSIAFTGKARAINLALKSMTLHTTTAGKVTMKVTATADDTKLAYEPISSHYYGFVRALNVTWDNALTGAAALTFRDTPAYLAAVGSDAENEFISYNIEDAANAWIAATDKDTEGDFKWATGETTGQTFWKARCAIATGADGCTGANNVVGTGDYPNTYKVTSVDNPLVNTYASWDRRVVNKEQMAEPNNWNGDEDYVVTNWQGTSGLWNDLKGDSSGVGGYIVEYAAKPGQLFTGVYEGSASYNVVATPSSYAPTSLDISKYGHGQIELSWKKPAVTAPTGLKKMLNKSKLTGYTVTASTRAGETFCTSAYEQKNLRCGIKGFLPGEEISIMVTANYSRPPLGMGLTGKGQKSFGAVKSVEPDYYPIPAILDTRVGRYVRTGAMVTLNETGMKPNTPYTLKANGVVVASGTSNASGEIAANTKINFPVTELAKFGRDQWVIAFYTLNYTAADGTAKEDCIMYIFSGGYLLYASGGWTTAAYEASMFKPFPVVPHTPVAQ